MEFVIKQQITVEQLQEVFAKSYPFLKIEFFEPVAGVSGVRKRHGVSPETLLQKIRNKQNEGVLTFDDNTTVAQLEQRLADVFGITSQVYRRAGNMWIETNITDMWTLAHQNEQGRLLSIKDGIGVNGLHRNSH